MNFRLKESNTPEVGFMNSENLRPEEHEKRVNEYLDSINHAPYFTIILITAGIFCVFTFLILIGAF